MQMALLIILGVLFYFVMWIFTAVLAIKSGFFDKDGSVMCALWPIVLPIVVVDIIVRKIVK